jgi:hypothetical protein
MTFVRHPFAGPGKEMRMVRETKLSMDDSNVPHVGHTSGEQQFDDPTAGGRILQSGTHLARILAVKQPDDTYEAQVYVRLSREPQRAETYIPVGTFGSEAEAWAAAEQRANRAFNEHEF